MMKWKVTRGPRCASADRSLDYSRKIVDEYPEPTKLRSTFSSDSKNGQTCADKDVVLLSENRKPAQNSDGNRNKSFVAKDCINLKGIFGITKDNKCDGHYTSSTTTSTGVERKRSRSEVRGTSIDRLTVGYHANPLFGHPHPTQNGVRSPSSKTRSSSPIENGGRWARGRRRERDSRPPFQSNNVTDTITVIADSNPKFASIKKVHQVKTAIPEPLNKPQKVKVCKASAGQLYQEKENHEVIQHPTSDVVELGSRDERIIKPVRRNNGKKRIAPKPHVRPSLFEDNKSEAKLSEGPRNDNMEEKMERDAFSDCKTDIKSVKDYSEDELTESNMIDLSESKITVMAEVHVDQEAEENINMKRNELGKFDKRYQHCDEREMSNKDKNTKIVRRRSKHVKFCETTKNIEIPPDIDEPDYTPDESSSDEEEIKSYRVIEVTAEALSVADNETNTKSTAINCSDEIKNHGEDFVPRHYKENGFNCQEENVKMINIESPPSSPITLITVQMTQNNQNSSEEQIVTDASPSPDHQVMDTFEFQATENHEESDMSSDFRKDIGIHINEVSVDVIEVAISDDAVKDMVKQIAEEDKITDVQIKKSCQSRSPTPPPRKKVASHKVSSKNKPKESTLSKNRDTALNSYKESSHNAHNELTVNVVVRQSPPPDTMINGLAIEPIGTESPPAFVMRKSFVITVAKQNEGFRSLCASKDLTFPQENESIKDNQISVTFLCSETASEGDCLDDRFRSVSVPPHCTHDVDLLSLASHRSCSKDRRFKEKNHSSKKKSKSRKRVSAETAFHMPQAVIDELSQVLENRKIVPDGQAY